VGRYLERVDQIGRTLLSRAHQLSPIHEGVDHPLHWVHYTGLLRICSAHDAYFRTHGDRIDPEGVIQYLVLDAHFPRSIRFGIECCLSSLQEISGTDEDEYGSEAERLLGRLEGELRYLEADEILTRGLTSFLLNLLSTCRRVGDEIHHAYFFT
jgi:uncharacterized alpha-E superfamily protein